MISDKQGKKWLLQKLYDDGWRYCICRYNGELYLTNTMPMMDMESGYINIYSCNKFIYANCLKSIFPKMKGNEVLKIATELGVVDWSKVPVDTPVIVWDKCPEISQRRYFAKFKHGQIFTWNEGATSWSAFSKDACTPWLNGKLAECCNVVGSGDNHERLR